ncbi:MAG: GNAT family N-acetyltransferase [Methylococcales bacterium]|nr:GNAT family N-acetyltransferase [Methylococcales bacterium]
MKFESHSTPDAWQQAITKKFNTKLAISEQEIAKLRGLPPREIFETLTGKTPNNTTSALHYLTNFASPQMVDFLAELSADSTYRQYKSDFAYVLEGLSHQQQSSAKSIRLLKKLGDRRAIEPFDGGVIERALSDSAAEILKICPTIDPAFLKECLQQGLVHLLETKKHELATFAIAHPRPQFSLYIDYIFTSPQERGKGYGEKLMAYLIKQHAPLKATLLRGNMLSQKSLERLGFKRTDGEHWEYDAAAHLPSELGKT